MQVQRQCPELRPRSQGFSLVELLTTIAVIAVLSAVGWVATAGRIKAAAKQTQLKSDIHQVLTAINLYRIDNDNVLPRTWKNFGYYKLARKGSYGGGYPLVDTYSDKPPSYDVSYQTPECALPPKANMTFVMSQIDVDQFALRPRANVIDIEQNPAVLFAPACLANSKTNRKVKVMQGGIVNISDQTAYRTLGGNLAGSISYQFDPEWLTELAVGY